MRIGVDARLYGLEHTGIGRYVQRLVVELLKKDKKNHYILFVRPKYAHEFDSYENVSIRVVNTPIYGFLEQILLPVIYMFEKLDLLHIPHFNAPILYPGKIVVTIHDLIKHYSKGKETTTRQGFLYTIKRIGYLFLVSAIIRKATKIIVPSKFVKGDLIRNFNINEDKITVTYESVDAQIKIAKLSDTEKKQVLKKYGLAKPFIAYTGSLYPHKNVDLLIDAVIDHNRTREVDLNLAIICARNVFYERMNQKIISKQASGFIKLLGFLPDEEVSKLYSLALCLVHPSKMEGFGLTGLEAMKVGLPVISSSASCLPEVYGDAALFFDPDSKASLMETLSLIIGDRSLREKLVSLGLLQVKKYSWARMAKETLKVYQEASTG